MYTANKYVPIVLAIGSVLPLLLGGRGGGVLHCSEWPSSALTLIQAERDSKQEESPDTRAATAQAELTRRPLLRESTRLVDAAGYLHRDPDTGRREYVLNKQREDQPSREFILMPCHALQEMEQIAEATEEKVLFSATGRLFVFRGHNYFLPGAATAIELFEKQPESDPEIDETTTTSSPDDPVATIEEALKRRVGSVGRSVRTTPDKSPSETNKKEKTHSDDLMTAGKHLVLRRGSIVRNSSTGAWRFIFAADAEGTSDPPLDLLPCQLLERIADYARGNLSNPPVLLSGTVHVYRGRNYLLPTMFQIPHTSTNLRP